MIENIGAFLLFPIYVLGYALGFLFETFKFGFDNGRKGLN